jgi:hypothetical protein
MFHLAAFSRCQSVFHFIVLRSYHRLGLYSMMARSSDMHACSACITQVVSVENFFELELTLAKQQIDTLDAELHAQMHLLANSTQVRLRVSSLILES